MKQKLYVIVGPTATGKTAVAVELAKRLGGEVVSADSMQIYREMDIGTAKPTQDERQGIPHHMIDIASPDDAYSAALYQHDARLCIENILAGARQPIVAGGTGLYINAITHNLDFSGSAGDSVLRGELEGMDAQELYDMLLKLDEEAAARIHPHNKKRVIRAIEVAKGKDSLQAEYDFERKNDDYEFVIVGLRCEREILYDRINRRVDDMIRMGLTREVEELYGKYGWEPISMQAIGYKEWRGYFEREYSLDDTVELIKRNTRRFAKRQMTWFNRDARINWQDISTGNAQSICDSIINKQREEG